MEMFDVQELDRVARRDHEILDALRSRDLTRAEHAMLDAPQAQCSVIHHFGPGLCVREVFLPAGAFVVGHRHKTAHLNVFLKGRLRMVRDDGSTEELVAPMMFVGQPGRKCCYVIEDVVWQNIFATEETDIQKIEAQFLDKSEGFAAHQERELLARAGEHADDRADYAAALLQTGFDEATARAISESTADQCPFPHGAWRVKTGPSPIEGTGLFATTPIASGELIAPARIGGLRTPAGRFTNHSRAPNAEMVSRANGDIDLVALCDIGGCRGGQDGDEITIDYRQALALSGIC
ncbi:MAG: SET domain-containing protein-lysine N-methyltransferase [Paraburkholderia sp.]|uniref:SET domain-containing protein-lysine N-methyltransferase n=1 Tax=Paraburkholderia sp. TaxID=1926495 RepID=UPI0011FA3E1B|nr:SET domain-containing protein-lysine N-methyltransferase [Paraburkholderia sp.]TAM08293.1 MAG: SET domain-containing protein-lysine N-methyltransferase [Paraburkholderia sp.]TAM28053.1 MAG: SET domain-containing protein-lysine N-methyltransferase [Paraburkholderia sp.]